MTEQGVKSQYRFEGGKHLIEVRVKDSQRLFDLRDPAPFREKDLDEDFVQYINSAVREFSFPSLIKIVIYIEEPEPNTLNSDAIREAIHSHFFYQIELQTGNLRRYVKRAQVFLLIGLLALGACLGFAQSIPTDSKPGFTEILREGIIIFGWVSIWKPIELILFDWYPLYENLRFDRKLFSTEIDVRFAK